MAKSRDFDVISVPGLSSFQDVYALQEKLLDQRILDQVPDTLIFCEHTSVITRGRGLQKVEGRDVRAMPLTLMPKDTDYVETTRGGDLTWHGPGQLVVYPIIKLGGEGVLGKAIGQDIHRYIRFLESIFIELLAESKIHASSKPDGSGVWIGPKKVASVGIALKRWVSYHGIAINVVNDLQAFQAFDPCGFEAKVMTNLKEQSEISRAVLGADWRSQWESLIERTVSRQLAV
jgi:lipoyl(octanoyl) transferase